MKKLLILLSFILSLSAVVKGQKQESRTYMEFDGETQYLSVAPHPDFDIPLGQSYTIAFWMYGDRTLIYGDSQRIVSRRDVSRRDADNNSGYEILGLRTTSNEFIGASMPDGAGGYIASINGWAKAVKPSFIRSWYHIAMVIDRKTDSMRIYVDGQEALCRDHIRAWSSVNDLPLIIGAGLNQGEAKMYFAGRLDNIRFYRRALSPDEVRIDGSTLSIGAQTDGLIAAFDFDNYKSGDTTILDVTGRHIATMHGYPSVQNHLTIKTYTDTKSNGHLIGRGNNQALRVLTLGVHSSAQLQSLVLRTGESVADDIRAFKLYVTDVGDRFDHRRPGTLVAIGKPSTKGEIRLTSVGNAPVLTSQSKLWLVADVKPKAREGRKVTTEITSIQLAGHAVYHPESRVMQHEIVLGRTLLWTPGENNSAHYRIPGIVRLDNGHLVASIDRRKNTDYDLPSDIDVEVKISRDNGVTWGRPITVAHGSPEYGYGDAAITTDGKNIYMVMVAGSGLWFYPSQASKPLGMYFAKSSDGGYTWTKPVEITDQVYTDRYPNGGFFGSGNGIITSRGRIAFVAAMRTDSNWGGQMDNVMVYSDDQGKTWHSSPVARANGDEAKIVELASGDLLISSRNRAWKPTPRTYVISHDHGQSWSEPKTWTELQGNACNVALTRYSLARDGRGQGDILLHTLIEASNRTNLRIYMSEDEGQTWPVGNTICTGEAAYSEVVRLKDGTIGIISEENDRPAYDIYFTRVSLDWIRQGGKNPNLK